MMQPCPPSHDAILSAPLKRRCNPARPALKSPSLWLGRCGRRVDDLSARAWPVAGTAAEASCGRLHPTDRRCSERVENGDGTWTAMCTPADSFLTEHCAPPGCAGDRAWPADGRCNAECYSGPERFSERFSDGDNKTAAGSRRNGSQWSLPEAAANSTLGTGASGCLLYPTGPVLAAGETQPYDPFDAMAGDVIEHFITVYLLVSAGIVLLGIYAACQCCWQPDRQKTVRRLSIGLSFCFVALAVAGLAGASYAYTNAEQFDEFVSRDSLLYGGIFGSAGILIYALLGCCVVWRRSKLGMLVFMAVLAGMTKTRDSLSGPSRFEHEHGPSGRVMADRGSFRHHPLRDLRRAGGGVVV